MTEEKEEREDGGLGLGDFLDAPQESEKEEASPEEEASEASPEEEAKEKTKEQPPPKEEAGETKEEQAGAEEKPESEEKPKVDWDSNDNPLKKQLGDTRTYANSEHQAKLDLEKKVTKLEKQLDGTWDESEEAKGPSPEELEFEGKAKASLRAAQDKYGADFVSENITNEGSPYHELRKNNPLIDLRIRHADAPYMEAVTILKEEEFFGKYGRDPEVIKEAVKKELESELRATITKEFQDKLKAKEKLPVGIGDARSAIVNKDDKGKPKTVPLTEIFSNT